MDLLSIQQEIHQTMTSMQLFFDSICSPPANYHHDFTVTIDGQSNKPTNDHMTTAQMTPCLLPIAPPKNTLAFANTSVAFTLLHASPLLISPALAIIVQFTPQAIAYPAIYANDNNLQSMPTWS